VKSRARKLASPLPDDQSHYGHITSIQERYGHRHSDHSSGAAAASVQPDFIAGNVL